MAAMKGLKPNINNHEKRYGIRTCLNCMKRDVWFKKRYVCG